MIENRELTMDDYLAMLRRRMKLILIPAVLAPIAGFLLSFAFTARYTSTSLVLVEEQKVPEGYVKPVVNEDLVQRIATMQQQVLSRNALQPMIARLGLAKNGQNTDELMDEIRLHLAIEPVEPDITASRQRRPGQNNDVPGFYVKYTWDNPHDAQQICNELTSMLLAENLKARQQVAQSTTDFLGRQLDEAKKKIDSQDAKLAAFKRQYLGQLPGDNDNNMKMLAALNSQLDAATQAVNRAQQDKTYTESVLAQQLSAWKVAQSRGDNPDRLQQELQKRQDELVTLRARYTDDYPDVIKAKADIAELKKKINEAGTSETPEATRTGAEPPEIRQLRLQAHQLSDVIAQASREQKRIAAQIQSYQGKISLSPSVEEQYKSLTRDYDTAQKFYNELLAKKSESEMATDMERRQQGEQMRLLNPADFPDKPSFPNRYAFAGGGLGLGLALGCGLALWLELRDKSIRTEQDVEAVLELPTLVAVPWVGAEPGSRTAGKPERGQAPPVEKEETVGV